MVCIHTACVRVYIIYVYIYMRTSPFSGVGDDVGMSSRSFSVGRTLRLAPAGPTTDDLQLLWIHCYNLLHVL